MDYVHGRACKFNVFNFDGELAINERWYDHTPYQLQKLMETVGV